VAETTLGTSIRAGFAREDVVTAQTWPADQPAQVTNLWPITNIQPGLGANKHGVMSVGGGVGLHAFDLVSLLPAATFPMQGTYEGLESFWACALGYMAKRLQGTVMPEQLAPGVYRHLFELDAVLSTAQAWDAAADGFVGGELLAGQRRVRRGTLALDMGYGVWEWLSTMVQAFTFQLDATGATLSVETLAHSLSHTSSVNTTASLRACPPVVAPRVLLSDLQWRLAPYSATTPLSAGDAVTCLNWTLRLDNLLTAGPGPRTGLAPEEYERTAERHDAPYAAVTFVLPRRTSDLWVNRWGANTRLMGMATCTSERFIAPGWPYRLTFYVPSAVILNAQPNMQGAQLPLETVQLACLVPPQAPAGFSASQHLNSLMVEVVSGRADHPLL